MKYKVAKDPDALLKALQEHEHLLAKLYQAYARRFDEYTTFWSDLAHEELKHAACLNKLRLLLKEDPTITIIERFSIDAIQFSIKYVNELIERASQPEFQLVNAFALAMKLEEALLERNFFEVLDGDDHEIRETLEFLAKETEHHFHLLDNTSKDYKNRIA